MNPSRPTPRLAEPPDPLTAALRAALAPLVREALIEAIGEIRDGEQIRPALLNSDQLCAALQISRATLYRIREQGLPCILLGESPRFELEAVLAWLRARSEARCASAGEGAE